MQGERERVKMARFWCRKKQWWGKRLVDTVLEDGRDLTSWKETWFVMEETTERENSKGKAKMQ